MQRRGAEGCRLKPATSRRNYQEEKKEERIFGENQERRGKEGVRSL